MRVDLYRLDFIQDYDEAIAALEDYVADLVEEFVEAPEGKTYLETHPEMQAYFGNWIDNLLYFGYAYDESVTLPHMTQDNVEEIVTGLFPRKVSLPNLDEVDTAIPELMAFWQFLKRVYKHPNASRVLTFLKQIQPKFKGMMADPSNFGVAKSFFMAGNQAGFDMTTEEGLQAFQSQSNQNLHSSAAQPSTVSDLENWLGDLIPPVVDSSKMRPGQAQLQNFVSSLLGTTSQAKLPLGGNGALGDCEEPLHVTLSQAVSQVSPPLSAGAIALLKQQQITETQPGSILQDFQTLLDFVGDKGIVVSGKHCLIPLKSLTDLNQSLSEPIQLDLKRPQQ